MRPIPDALRERFLSDLQTAANNADPRLSAIISRGAFPVTSGADIARALITEADGLTGCSVAVRRPRAGHEPDRVYVAYIDENGAHVKFSALGVKMGAFVWQDGGFSEDASDVALAFDGTMPKAADGTAQFVTGERPWVFWIESGVLKGRILGLLGDVTLASANAGRVSAIRATWTQATSTDFGLVVFFTLNGGLYYRQLIDNEWYDAVPVSFGPPGVTWTDVAAFRTWDYRVGVQLLGSDGKVYELFTQFQGIGKHGAEHIGLAAAAAGDLTYVTAISGAEREHLSLSAAVATPFGGLYKLGAPSMLSAENVADSGGDYGRIVNVRMDRILDPGQVAAQNTSFRLTDARGVVYVPQAAAVTGDGFTLRLTFMNFNSAQGVCVISYAPGTVQTMAGAAVPALSVSFTPAGLEPPVYPPPAPASVRNDGNTQIIVTFDAELDANLAGAADHLSAVCMIPDFSPGGQLVSTPRRPASVMMSGSDTLVLSFASGNQTALNNAVGDVAVVYDGAGPLAGDGNPVAPFSVSFTPTGLDFKPDEMDAEHLSLAASAAGDLIAVTYRDGFAPEHLTLAASAAGTLIHIDDL